VHSKHPTCTSLSDSRIWLYLPALLLLLLLLLQLLLALRTFTTPSLLHSHCCCPLQDGAGPAHLWPVRGWQPAGCGHHRGSHGHQAAAVVGLQDQVCYRRVRHASCRHQAVLPRCARCCQHRAVNVHMLCSWSRCQRWFGWGRCCAQAADESSCIARLALLSDLIPHSHLLPHCPLLQLRSLSLAQTATRRPPLHAPMLATSAHCRATMVQNPLTSPCTIGTGGAITLTLATLVALWRAQRARASLPGTPSSGTRCAGWAAWACAPGTRPAPDEAQTLAVSAESAFIDG
jgi:hypothetical protein